MPKTRAIVAYVPVIHRGYLNFFQENSDYSNLYVIDSLLLKETDYIRKDLRALEPKRAAEILKSSGLFKSVSLLNPETIKKLDTTDSALLMPDEDVSRAVGSKFTKAKVKYYPVFLRWDRQSVDVNAPLEEERTTSDSAHKKFMTEALELANESSDIWRHVGAVLVSAQGKKIAGACNKGEPSSHTPWALGDPRNIFNRGVGIEMSSFTHAEAILIAEAAKKAVSTDGASIYVTTYPCPACAKLIARSGIKKLFYLEGYAVLDGKSVLDAYDVESYKVEMPQPPKDARRAVDYTK